MLPYKKIIKIIDIRLESKENKGKIKVNFKIGKKTYRKKDIKLFFLRLYITNYIISLNLGNVNIFLANFITVILRYINLIRKVVLMKCYLIKMKM